MQSRNTGVTVCIASCISCTCTSKPWNHTTRQPPSRISRFHLYNRNVLTSPHMLVPRVVMADATAAWILQLGLYVWGDLSRYRQRQRDQLQWRSICACCNRKQVSPWSLHGVQWLVYPSVDRYHPGRRAAGPPDGSVTTYRQHSPLSGQIGSHWSLLSQTRQVRQSSRYRRTEHHCLRGVIYIA